MKLYKLTDENDQTAYGTSWGPNVTNTATGLGLPLCTDGWIHAYEHPLIAVLLNSVHADFKNPHLWEAEGELGIRDAQIKCGCKSITTLRLIPLPKITRTQKLAIAIRCVLSVTKGSHPNFRRWAKKWLSGKDRTVGTALKAKTREVASSVSAHGKRWKTDEAVWLMLHAASYRGDWDFRAASAITSVFSIPGVCYELDLVSLAEKTIKTC